jgi:glycosyltransferase involved in cell wall biosynthesis
MEYFAAARKYLNGTGGRMIFTLHEFLAICLADGHMARTFNKSPCDRASSVRCHQCFPHKTPEFFSIRRMWFQHHFDMVDTFVATSLFGRQRYVEWGIPAEKIVHIPAGHRKLGQLDTTPAAMSDARTKRNRFAFFGQLIDCKGLLVLFDAVRIMRGSGSDDFTLDVYGANLDCASAEFRREFEAFWAEEKRASNGGMQRIRLNGAYEVSDLARLMADVDWVVVPSRWGETFMMVISEAFAFGKPVICSNIGVMVERVRDNETGLHFVVGSSNSLAAAMTRAMTEDALWERLSGNIEPPPTAEISAQRHIELCYGPRDCSAEMEHGLTSPIA